MQASWFNWMYLFVSFVHQVVVTLIAQIFVCLAHLLSWHLLILYSGVFNDSSTANVTESKSKSFYMSYAVLAFSFPRRILQFFLMLLIHLVFSHFSSTLLFFIQPTWIFRVVSSLHTASKREEGSGWRWRTKRSYFAQTSQLPCSFGWMIV